MTSPKPSPFRYVESEKQKNMYVDKQRMLQLIKEYQNDLKYALEHSEEEPVMSEELGKNILDIATSLSKRYNFVRYSYTDMFISDSVLLGLHLAKTFDVDHPSANPYSYFSFSFFRVMMNIITREEKLLQGKYAYISQLDIDTSAYQEHDDGHNNAYIEYLKENVDQARMFEEKMASKQETIEEDAPATVTPASKRVKRVSKYAVLDF